MKCDVCGHSCTWTQPVEPGVGACGDCIAARNREDSGPASEGNR
jgi:hypothetical protein